MSKRERIEALEARVAALEASNTPGGLGDTPDNTPGGECWSCDATTCPCADPEPVPQWRASVDAARRFLTGEDPLVTVLRSLACVADDSKVTDANLARIVAVREAQVGDGWQADPSGWVATPSIHALLHGLTMDPREVAFPETNWRYLANAASAWLRDLTEAER